jgi:hypothetical protein
LRSDLDITRALRIAGLVVTAAVTWLSLGLPMPLIVAVPLLLAGLTSAMAVWFAGFPLKPSDEEMRAGVSRRTVLVSIGVLILALVPVVLGGGVTGETPHIRNGVRVATVHGAVVREISETEYNRLKNGQIRVLCACGTFCFALSLILGDAVADVRKARATLREGTA